MNKQEAINQVKLLKARETFWLSEQESSDEDVEALKNDGKYALIRLIDEYNSQLEEENE